MHDVEGRETPARGLCTRRALGGELSERVGEVVGTGSVDVDGEESAKVTVRAVLLSPLEGVRMQHSSESGRLEHLRTEKNDLVFSLCDAAKNLFCSLLGMYEDSLEAEHFHPVEQ